MDHARAGDDGDCFEVFEENWPTVEVFLQLQTQWQINNGAWVGLYYSSIDFILRLRKSEDQLEIFEGLRVMEAAALGLLNKKGD